jgi:predicted dienelactone hydrolase
MIWTRVFAVAIATLMIGSLSLAQEAKPEPAPATENKIDPNKAPAGALKVTRVDDIKLNDEGRKKELVLSAVFPEDTGKYPVIVFSHGANAYATSGNALAEYWASHGFVVLIPAHTDARQSEADRMFAEYDADKDGKLSKEELPEQFQAFFDTLDKNEDGFLTKDELAEIAGRGGRGNRGGRGGEQPAEPEKPKDPPKEGEDEFDMVGDPAEMLLEDPAQPEEPQPRQGGGRQGRQRTPPPALDAKAGVDRVADIKLILDNAEALVKAAPGLKDKMDLEKVGVSGHNHGAYTAELIAGASVNIEETVKAEDGTESKKSETRNVADARIKAILALSPAGPDQGGLTKESFKGLKLPMMTMTGTNDTTGEKQDAAWKKQAYELAPEGGKYHIVIEGASNSSFTAPRRSFNRGGEQPPADPTFDWVKTSTLQFWNATLKGDEAAKTWLAGEGLKEGTAGKAAIERK